jgi:SAM-dependent methyltransferase
VSPSLHPGGFTACAEKRNVKEKMARSKELARTFGKAVSDYDKGRPGYPDSAIDWILGQTTSPDRNPDVVDIGAGTGKFTRSLAARSVTLSAVEPDAQMLARLTQNIPSAAALAGSAESIPLPDSSQDLVTLAQAWHWVDEKAASAEIGRVLRPTGILALVWNIRDESVDWIAQLGKVIGSSAAEEYSSVEPRVEPPLERSDYAEFRWESVVSHDELFAMVASRSYIIALPAAEKADLFARVDALLETHADLAGRTEFTIAYVTRVTIASRIHNSLS